MNDQDERKRKIEEFRQQMRAKTSTDPEEIERFWAKVKAQADPNQPPYVLEFLYDPRYNTVILQGNQAGLQHLLNTVALLARPEEAAGAHAHFDSDTNFTENNMDLIIQRVNDDGSGGAHGLPENKSSE